MSTLFAKNGFSRPSLKYCGVFRHVLGLGLRTARPIKNHCDYSPHQNPCSRRTRKATAAFASHEENWFVFSRSQRSSAPSNHRNSVSELYSTIAKHHVSEGNT